MFVVFCSFFRQSEFVSLFLKLFLKIITVIFINTANNFFEALRAFSERAETRDFESIKSRGSGGFRITPVIPPINSFLFKYVRSINEHIFV